MANPDAEPKRPKQRGLRSFCIMFDPEDWELLSKSSAADKLSKAEVLRRGMRDYARRLGVFDKPTET